MRTTLTIDNDVLAAAKELAAQQQKTVGEVISDLARRALNSRLLRGNVRNGVPLLPPVDDAVLVTSEMIKRLQDHLPE
jgi:hypothetical protein